MKSFSQLHRAAARFSGDDRIVYEWYSPDLSAAKPHFTASMAKALVGGVSVAVALSDGRFTLDDPASRSVEPSAMRMRATNSFFNR